MIRIFAPHRRSAAVPLLERWSRNGAAVAGLLGALGVYAAFLGRRDSGGALYPALALIVQLGLATRLATPAAGALLTALCPLQVAFAHAVAPGAVTRLLLPAAAAVSCVSATWLHAWFSGLRLPAQERARPERESSHGLLQRACYGLALSAVLLLGLWAGESAAASLRRLDWPHLAAAPESTAPGGAAQAAEEPEIPPRIFPGNVGWKGRISEPAADVLLRVQAFHNLRGQRVPYAQPRLYLKAQHLDTVSSLGLTSSAAPSPREYQDADDGRTDGWVLFQSGHEHRLLLELDLLQTPLSLDNQRGFHLLLHLEPLVAVRRAPLWRAPEGPLLARWTRERFLAYRILVVPPPPAALVRAAVDRSVAAAYLQLPPPLPVLERAFREAATLFAGAESDGQRIDALLRHFADQYQYSLEVSPRGGWESLADFLEQKRGYCTYFATASLLFLRSAGIPCRFASGYLAVEREADGVTYLVRARNAHAWLEVPYQGLGWCVVDPTPPARLNEALQPLQREDRQAPPPPWMDSGTAAPIKDALPPFSDPGKSTGPPAAVGSPGPTASSAVSLGGVGLVVALLVAAWMASRLLAGAAGTPDPPFALSPAASAALAPYQELLRLLHARGFHKRSAQTPREFSRQVASRGGGAYAPFEGITEAWYRARYGAKPPTAAEQQDLADFAALLRQDPS